MNSIMSEPSRLINNRCKHLCCREGVEKAPRAPKCSTNSGASSKTLVGSLLKNGVKSAPQPKSHGVDSATQGHRRNIQTIDLTSDGDQNEYAQNGPYEYRKLHKLHKSVNKGSSVPTIALKPRTVIYATGSQPQEAFLTRPFSTSNWVDKPSSEYGDGWIDDFPSPSLLFDGNKRQFNAATERDTPYVPEKVAFDGNSVSGSAEHYEDKNSAVIVSNDKSQSADPEAPHGSVDRWENSIPALPKLPRVVSQQRDCMGSMGSDGKLFCSTDSPEKTSPVLGKRGWIASLEIKRPKERPDAERRSGTLSPQIRRYPSDHDSHTAKRQRVDHSSNPLPPLGEVGQHEPSMNTMGWISEASRRPWSVGDEGFYPDTIAEAAYFAGTI
jgi:hypothetical protein